MKDLLGLTIEELKGFAAGLGEKPFRGKQLFIWINRGVTDFDEMTDLPAAFRERLKEVAYVGGATILDVQKDPSDGTHKFLIGFTQPGGSGKPAAGSASAATTDTASATSAATTDAASAASAATTDTASAASAAAADTASATSAATDAVESVFMKYRYGNTLCVSSQVGCKMGCVFCASALDGFRRNLTPGEMLAQVYKAEEHTGETIGHIVVMGMGEPFDNYDNVAGFLRLLHDAQGKNMSYRNMTVSTSGIIPGIEKFAEDFPQANLAISLHRLTDDGRSQLMPVNRRYPLEELLSAAREYTEKTHRRITFEYTLIRDENDGLEDLKLIRQKLGGMLCHVNLIPLNKVEETGFEGSDRRRAEAFAKELEKSGISATVRRELGSEIDGACGQLRLRSGL